MIKLRRIIICDHCNEIALPRVWFGDRIYRDLPHGWGEIGNNVHLCKKCYDAFKALMGDDDDDQ